MHDMIDKLKAIQEIASTIKGLALEVTQQWMYSPDSENEAMNDLLDTIGDVWAWCDKTEKDLIDYYMHTMDGLVSNTMTAICPISITPINVYMRGYHDIAGRSTYRGAKKDISAYMLAADRFYTGGFPQYIAGVPRSYGGYSNPYLQFGQFGKREPARDLNTMVVTRNMAVTEHGVMYHIKGGHSVQTIKRAFESGSAMFGKLQLMRKEDGINLCVMGRINAGLLIGLIKFIYDLKTALDASAASCYSAITGIHRDDRERTVYKKGIAVIPYVYPFHRIYHPSSNKENSAEVIDLMSQDALVYFTPARRFRIADRPVEASYTSEVMVRRSMDEYAKMRELGYLAAFEKLEIT